MADDSWTESALLEGVSEDGETAFIVRIQRHPALANDWLWVHVFAPGEAYGFNANDITGSPGRIAIEGAHAAYRVGSREGGIFADVVREGPPGAPTGVSAEVRTWAHRGDDAPPGPGLTALRLAAVFTPEGPLAPSAPDRCEALGAVKATFDIGGRKSSFSGRGHWREQHQQELPFATPFTCLSAQGDGLSVVAVRTPARAEGFVLLGQGMVPVSQFRVSRAAYRRAIVLRLDGGTELEGVLETTHRYSVDLGGQRQPGSVVRGGMDGIYLVGTVSDWMENRFPPEIER